MTGQEWLGQVDVEQVAAARAGDRAALDAIVAAGLPLVYNIAGRALSSTADVDDVVQETMVRVLRGIEGLREPDRLRSWLVAVTINQIREHHRRRAAAPAPLEEYDRPDPGAEFVEVALSRLHLAEQRREVDEAARWLDPADSELLALWTLERVGQLTRAEVAEALNLGAHAVTVRVSRLKGRLEIVRELVRALGAEPRCAGLARAAEGWSGRPSPLWRKRLLRHIDDCADCADRRPAADDALPVERILTGAVLLTVPAGYLPHLLESLSRVAPAGAFARMAHVVAAKPLLATGGAALVAAVVGVVGAVVLAPADRPATALASETSTFATTTSTTSALPTSSTLTTTTTTTTTTTPPPKPATPEERVLALINSTRAAAGLPPMKLDPALVTAADRHNQAMIAGCGLSHRCPGESGLGERATAAGAKWSSVGENVGMAGPVPNAVEPISQKALGLTQSMIDEKPPNDGHRRNILSESFTRVGIVVTRDARGTVWMTHDFAG